MQFYAELWSGILRGGEAENLRPIRRPIRAGDKGLFKGFNGFANGTGFGTR